MCSSGNHVNAGKACRNAQIQFPVTLPVNGLKKHTEGDEAFPRNGYFKMVITLKYFSVWKRNKMGVLHVIFAVQKLQFLKKVWVIKKYSLLFSPYKSTFDLISFIIIFFLLNFFDFIV